MSSSDYSKEIIDRLIKKYNTRQAKNVVTGRRIILKPTEIYRAYDKNNADANKKQEINKAILELTELGFVSAKHLKFSDEIEKIYLLDEKINLLYTYLNDRYGIIPQSVVSDRLCEIIKAYNYEGDIVKKYCESILEKIEDPRCSLDPARIEATLKMIHFLEKNTESIYVREASMLVYGDSKSFESTNYEEVCAFLRTAVGMDIEESGRNDSVLNLFNVIPVEQEISLKGNWKLEWEDHTLETFSLQGGIAITARDFSSIKRIESRSKSIMTIENKTSYQRMKNNGFDIIYLGGFANYQQIEFLKRVISDNPESEYLHFGDIDIGGFLIHRHLCRETSTKFALYCMGIRQLRDDRFRHCLKELTENDIIRMETLMSDATYAETLNYMKEHNVKLEQEIISYYLNREDD